MPRAIWKGAISFGLVHIPVALVSATINRSIDFDWLDRRSMDPVGYKRVNKVTGKEVNKDHIVKGVEYEKGSYVVLSDEEIRRSYPRSTQTIDILAFVEAGQISPLHIDTPYYLAPDARGGKVYALLREALVRTGKVAVANVVLHTRQHLAAVMPLQAALVLITLRRGDELRAVEDLELDETVAKAELNKAELSMARRLVEDMSEDWDPAQYADTFREQIMTLVERKASQGKLESVAEGETEAPPSADIIDLTELLKRSLNAKGSGNRSRSERAPGRSKAPAKAAAKTSAKAKKAPRKSPRKRAS